MLETRLLQCQQSGFFARKPKVTIGKMTNHKICAIVELRFTKLNIMKSKLFSFAFLFLGLSTIMAQSGAIDPTFAPGTGANSMVLCNVLQADGRVIIGGYFSSYAGNPSNRLARINTDGSYDLTFNIGTGANDAVFGAAVQADGKIVIVGPFSTVNGATHNGIARLNANGSIDNTFNSGAGFDGIPYNVALQTDGKIIIVGAFSSYAGVARNGITRINTDGSIDTSFDPVAGSGVSSINGVALQSDGKMLITGGFTTYNNVPRNHIARVNANGSLDTSFDPGTGFNSFTKCVRIQPDGRILVGGTFSNYNGTSAGRVIRINTDGTMDFSFSTANGANGDVDCMVLLNTGKIMIGGQFTMYGSTDRNYVAGINADGSLDTSFDPGQGCDWVVSSLSATTDNKLLITGGFTNYNGTASSRICRVLLGETEPVVYIPDLNFKLHLLGVPSINTNGDNEIQVSEAEAFTGSIACSSLNISDLTGIEAFTGITGLYCTNNQLTSLNVSANTQLVSLYCFDNQIANLDVSSNTVLYELICYNNQLTSLDVSSNAALAMLICGNNQLTSLDVSSNANLIQINCHTNSLNNLNVANGNNANITNANFYALNNPNLSCIQVDDEAYSTATWTNIDATTSFSENCTSVGIDAAVETSFVFEVYPNPANELIQVASLPVGANVYVSDLSGKLVYSSVAYGEQITINTSNFDAGLYLISVNQNGAYSTLKFVVNH
jgi:uncharacterized delta-60 repeat protein